MTARKRVVEECRTLYDASKLALLELQQMHNYYHPECKKESCPTREAITALKNAMTITEGW